MGEVAKISDQFSDQASVTNSTMELACLHKEEVFMDALLRQNTIHNLIRNDSKEMDHRSDCDSDEENFPKTHIRTRMAVFTLCHLVSTLMSMTLLLILTTTCTDGLQCQPQFYARLTDYSTEAQKSLDSAREGLNMISYLAKDLSPALNDNTNLLSQDTSTYLDVIDTLLTDNLYLFSYHGYCRHHTSNALRVCSRTAGLDVILVMIKDIGDQLGKISHADNYLDMGNYFLTAYLCLLKELERIWRRRNDKIGMEHHNWQSLAFAHHLTLLRIYARSMRACCDILVVLSIFSCVFLGGACVVFFHFPPRGQYCYRILTITSLMVAAIILLLSLNMLFSEIILIHFALLYIKHAAVALIYYGSGIYLFMYHTVMSCVSLAMSLCLAFGNLTQSSKHGILNEHYDDAKR